MRRQNVSTNDQTSIFRSQTVRHIRRPSEFVHAGGISAHHLRVKALPIFVFAGVKAYETPYSAADCRNRSA